jgi:hypothetical protein
VSEDKQFLALKSYNMKKEIKQSEYEYSDCNDYFLERNVAFTKAVFPDDKSISAQPFASIEITSTVCHFLRYPIIFHEEIIALERIVRRVTVLT